MSTVSSLKKWARNTKQYLTKSQEDYIRDNYSTKTKKEIAGNIGTTQYLVNRFMLENNLKRIRDDYNVEEKFKYIDMELNGCFNVFATDNWLV